jgi:hypothetical protein
VHLAGSRRRQEDDGVGHIVGDSRVPGRGRRRELVEAVRVDLNAGGTSTVTVSSAAPLDTDAVRAAIDEAGYSLVSA